MGMRRWENNPVKKKEKKTPFYYIVIIVSYSCTEDIFLKSTMILTNYVNINFTLHHILSSFPIPF